MGSVKGDLYFLFVILTKQQIQRLYSFLNFLTDDNTDVKQINFSADDIIVLAEPVKGEIENRAWRITPEGDAIDVPSFHHE